MTFCKMSSFFYFMHRIWNANMQNLGLNANALCHNYKSIEIKFTSAIHNFFHSILQRFRARIFLICEQGSIPDVLTSVQSCIHQRNWKHIIQSCGWKRRRGQGKIKSMLHRYKTTNALKVSEQKFTGHCSRSFGNLHQMFAFMLHMCFHLHFLN